MGMRAIIIKSHYHDGESLVEKVRNLERQGSISFSDATMLALLIYDPEGHLLNMFVTPIPTFANHLLLRRKSASRQCSHCPPGNSSQAPDKARVTSFSKCIRNNKVNIFDKL